MKQIKPKTKYECHLLAVFEDADFTSQLQEFLPEGWSQLSFREKGLFLLTNEKANKMKSNIAKKFHILSGDIDYYLLDMNEKGYKLSDEKSRVQYDEKDNIIKLSLSPDIKAEEFEKLWKRVAAVKLDYGFITTTKDKPPTNYKLVYAIFKGRLDGLTMPQLYKQYKAKKLNGYSGSTGLDQTEFNHYYSTYKPDNFLELNTLL